ncbi:MAG: zinc-ribbon domain-containing protein [Eggerthellaceae bacterium]|nr:zinc-ribbon domain-containing protein [Eggerthellaceae bacterium]
MFCPKCGENLADGAQFCGNCGSKLDKLDNKAAEDKKPNQSQASANVAHGGSAALMSNGRVAGISAVIFVVVMIVAGVSSGGFGLSHDSASSAPTSKNSAYSYSSSSSNSSSGQHYRNMDDLMDAIKRGEVDI